MTRLALTVGQRVQLQRGTERWMKGDRFGEVLQIEDGRVRLQLDPSGKRLWLRLEDVLPC